MSESDRASGDLCLGLLALIPSPWLVLISSSLSLFLANQADLGQRLVLIRPFALVWLAVVALGLCLLPLRRFWLGRLALWVYLLCGPVFVVWSQTRELASTTVAEIACLGALGGFTVMVLHLLRDVDPERSFRFWVGVGVLVVGLDLTLLTAGVSSPASPPPVEKSSAQNRSAASGADLPNVYQLLLDGYQADLFPAALTPEVESRLHGFYVFPDSVTPSGRTRVSIPSVFAGRSWDLVEPLGRFVEASMNSENSLLHDLSRAGYRLTAYLHSRFSFAPNLFDQVLYHQSFYGHPLVQQRLAQSDALKVLWIHRYAPRAVSRRLLGEALIERIEAGRLAPKAYSTGSIATFEEFLSREGQLGDSGRYTFVHLLLPHEPFVLDADCRYLGGDGASRQPLAQFRCATQAIAGFADRLRDLGRFERSLILIHADHGLDLVGDGVDGWRRVPFDAAGLDWNRPRSRPLLLYKPPGRDDAEPLRSSETPTSLLDLAPTILRDLGLASVAHHEGVAIDPERGPAGDRRRPYHYFIGNRSDEVFRFAIENGTIRPDSSSESP